MDTPQPSLPQKGEALITEFLTKEGISFGESDLSPKLKLIPVHTKGGTINLKLSVSANQVFGVFRTLENIQNLYMVYIWNIYNAEETVVYVMSFNAATEIAAELGWTRSEAWKQPNGGHSTSKPSERLLKALEPYRYSAGSLSMLLHLK
ncbi:MAG: hypothetical protein EOP04_25850 [Proteobacteria bacterium]|nr:MAG: hypothetical protein EOP04_25850 [Pseudomonadota bacterium]